MIRTETRPARITINESGHNQTPYELICILSGWEGYAGGNRNSMKFEEFNEQGWRIIPPVHWKDRDSDWLIEGICMVERTVDDDK